MKIFATAVAIILTFHCNAQWSLIHSDVNKLEVLDVFFQNKDTGYVCGQYYHGKGFVLITHDGGNIWTESPSDIMISGAICFVNDSIGYCGGQDGVVYKSVDYGSTWNYSGAVFLDDFNDLTFFDIDTGLMLDFWGSIYKTYNGGLTWNYKYSNSTSAGSFYERKSNSLFFENNNTGYFVRYGLHKTTDGGETWSEVFDYPDKLLRGIYMKNSLTGYIVGNDGVLLKTNDGWTTFSVDSLQPEDFRDIKFFNDSIGFIAGGGHGYFNDTTGIIMTTLDAGNTWTREKLSDVRLNSLWIVDSILYATGNAGNVFKNDSIIKSLFIVEPPPDLSNATVFPNPFSSLVTFNFPFNNGTIELFALTSQVVFTAANLFNTTYTFNISNLPSGVYIAKLSSQGDSKRVKVVKQ